MFIGNFITKMLPIAYWVSILILAFFNIHTINEKEIIIYVFLITISCWIIKLNCNALVKLGVILSISVIFHVGLLNVCLDIKYLFEDVVSNKSLTVSYLLYGWGYLYCLFQQWIIFFNHLIRQSVGSKQWRWIIYFIVSLAYLILALLLQILSLQIFIYYIPFIHYAAILMATVYLFIKKRKTGKLPF